MAIYIDVSPAIINRTAMYHIVCDTVQAIARSNAVKFLAMGRPIDCQIDGNAELSIGAKTQKDLSEFLFDRLRKAKIKASENEPAPLLERDDVLIVFDPLYSAFYAPSDLERAIVFVLDLTPILRPEWHSASADMYREAFEYLIRSQAKLLAISESTKRDLIVTYGLLSSEIQVIPLYLRRGFNGLLSQSTADSKRILCVGSLETRKNMVGLINGFTQSGLANDGFELRIAGNLQASHGAEVRRLAESSPGVSLLGYLTDDQLRQEYLSSGFFALPSKWEGFGLPALEALAAGLPSLFGQSGALPEVAGDLAVYCDPEDVGSIADGLRALVREKDRIRSKILQKRNDVLSHYSFENYISAISGYLKVIFLATYTFTAIERRADSQVAEYKGAKLISDAPPDSSKRQFLRKYLHHFRVFVLEDGEVPLDSYSPEYIYAILQNTRLKTVAAFYNIFTPKVMVIPRRVVEALGWMVILFVNRRLGQYYLDEMRLAREIKD